MFCSFWIIWRLVKCYGQYNITIVLLMLLYNQMVIIYSRSVMHHVRQDSCSSFYHKRFPYFMFSSSINNRISCVIQHISFIVWAHHSFMRKNDAWLNIIVKRLQIAKCAWVFFPCRQTLVTFICQSHIIIHRYPNPVNMMCFQQDNYNLLHLMVQHATHQHLSKYSFQFRSSLRSQTQHKWMGYNH